MIIHRKRFRALFRYLSIKRLCNLARVLALHPERHGRNPLTKPVQFGQTINRFLGVFPFERLSDPFEILQRAPHAGNALVVLCPGLEIPGRVLPEPGGLCTPSVRPAARSACNCFIQIDHYCHYYRLTILSPSDIILM
jgi:hypothetical protein